MDETNIGVTGHSFGAFNTYILALGDPTLKAIAPVAFGVEVPIFVELKVTSTEPGVKGDTAGGATKPATLETGMTVQVPLFINEGDVLKIDTRSGKYIERIR